MSPGLAVDGLGRELLAETAWCLDVHEWIKKRAPATLPQREGDTAVLTACLVAEFTCCPTAPVPALADPCDITRKHDDWSRVVETVRLSLRTKPSKDQPQHVGYQRVRALLGLTDAGVHKDSRDAVEQIAGLPPDERAGELLVRLIDAHLAEGNLVEAGRAYETYRDLLHRELGVAPTSDLLARLRGRPRTSEVA